jgi:hypothetical protein
MDDRWMSRNGFSRGKIVTVSGISTHYIVASGEADLACRITHMPKALFA